MEYTEEQMKSCEVRMMMLERVRRFVEEYELMVPGDRVIVAVSGGADSVCLLSVLAGIALELPVSLRVVHVHHGLRGTEADRDEAYVKELCERLGVPFVAVHRDVAGYAAEHGLSTEEAGRVLRYEALEAEAKAWDARAKIALAHHQEDNAETILHHLLRGSGLKGLSGIRPVQGQRIRPLLCAGRAEILAYLQEHQMRWCEDSTNASGDYTRNRIRSQVLPLLKEQVNERAVEHILQAGTIFAQADRYLEQQAQQIWETDGGVDAEAGAWIGLDAFCRQEDIIRTYLLRTMLDAVTPGWKDITRRHFTELARLAGRPVGSRLNLPCGMEARVDYDRLWICRVKVALEQTGMQTGVKMDETPSERMKMRVFSREKGMEIPKNQYTKWFDYDRIKGILSVRNRQEGDFFLLPDGGKKTVTRYMIDEKIPRQQRDEILVLAEDSHVLWVVGYRISEYYKITDDTRMILEARYNGGENYGR